jgi:hypothetical protein
MESNIGTLKTESPIEEIFAWECMKYLDNSVSLESQVEVNTEHGQFRIDFVMSHRGKGIAVECDGHDFHEGFRDEFRDAILLGEGHFETIYHFRGCDLTHRDKDCLWLISALDAYVFTERAHLILDKLHTLDDGGDMTNRESFTAFDSNMNCRFKSFRRSIHHKSQRNSLWPFWRALHKFANQYPHMSLDNLILRFWGKG